MALTRRTLIGTTAGLLAAPAIGHAQVMSQVTGVPIGPQRVAAARKVYAVQPVDDRIVAQQQEIADTFADLRIIPARIEVHAAVWR